MVRRSGVGVLVVVGMLVVSVLTAASVAAQTTVQRANYEALFADAIFQHDDGEFHLDVDVQAFTGHMKGGFVDDVGNFIGYEDFQMPGVFVQVVRYRLPEWEPVFQAYAFAEVTDREVWIDPQLRSAWIRTSLVATDETGASIPVTVDVTWAVDGRFVVDRGGFRLRPPDRVVSHVVARMRDGELTASGSVMVGPEHLTPQPTNAGFVMRTNGFYMTATRFGRS